MQLEKELIVDQQYSYLETIVTIENNNQISVSPNRKNYSSIVDNRIQLNFSFQHFSSFISISTKMNVIISCLHRLYSNSTHLTALLTACYQLTVELKFLNYPNSLLRKSIQHMTVTTTGEAKAIWSVCLFLLKRLLFTGKISKNSLRTITVE